MVKIVDTYEELPALADDTISLDLGTPDIADLAGAVAEAVDSSKDLPVEVLQGRITAAIAALKGELKTDLELAHEVLSSFKIHDDGSFEVTIPSSLKALEPGDAIQEVGIALNELAKARGFELPVFMEFERADWIRNEAKQNLRTEPGVAYRMRLIPESANKPREQQEAEHGVPAPIGALCIAEACNRLLTNNRSKLFEINGNNGWVRGSAPGKTLISRRISGVGFDRDAPNLSSPIIAMVYLEKGTE